MSHSIRHGRSGHFRGRHLGSLALALLLALTLVPAARAADKAKAADQGGEAPVIAVLDVQKVMRESTAAADVRQAVEKRRKAFEAEIDAERKKLKAEEDKLRQQQTVLSQEAFDKRRHDLERRYAELRRKADQAGSRLSDAANGAMHKLRQETAKIVADLMKERNINITLARSAVLVFDERLNVTDVVLKRLNEKLPRLQVDLSDKAPPPNLNDLNKK